MARPTWPKRVYNRLSLCSSTRHATLGTYERRVILYLPLSCSPASTPPTAAEVLGAGSRPIFKTAAQLVAKFTKSAAITHSLLT